LERVDALSALGERSYEVADRRDSARQCAGSDDAQRVVEGADGREHRDKAGHPRATGVDHELQEVRLGRADAS